MLTLQQKEIPSEQLEKAFNITVDPIAKESGPSSLPVKCQTLRTDNMSENRHSEGDKRYWRKVSFLTELPCADNFKSTGTEVQCWKSLSDVINPLSESEIVLRVDTTNSVKLAFPEFFPRDEMFCYNSDLQPLHRANADPILCSWMLLFGKQTIR